MTRIWQYNSQTNAKALLLAVFQNSTCPCCEGSPVLFESERKDESDGRRYSKYERAFSCELCGWWFYSRETWDSSCGSNPDVALRNLSVTGAALKRFSTSVSEETLSNLKAEIELHLRKKGSSIEWAALEDITSGILREFGHTPQVTSRSKDGGVDVLFEDTDSAQVFAQIKHSKNKVGVRVLRELVGTMAINGTRKSLLVTSSSFTSGVIKERNQAKKQGFFVELVEGKKFLSALNLTHRLSSPSLSEVSQIANLDTNLIEEEIHL